MARRLQATNFTCAKSDSSSMRLNPKREAMIRQTENDPTGWLWMGIVNDKWIDMLGSAMARWSIG